MLPLCVLFYKTSKLQSWDEDVGCCLGLTKFAAAAASAASAASWSTSATHSACRPQMRPRRRTRQPPPVKLLPGRAPCRKARSRDTCARPGGYCCPAAVCGEWAHRLPEHGEDWSSSNAETRLAGKDTTAQQGTGKGCLLPDTDCRMADRPATAKGSSARARYPTSIRAYRRCSSAECSCGKEENHVRSLHFSTCQAGVATA